MKPSAKWRTVFIVNAALVLGTFPAKAQVPQPDYYIYSQGDVQPVRNGDPSQIKPEYWTVWIFYDRNEHDEQQGAKCGAHDGKTAGEAVDAAKNFLDFNIRWAKYIYGKNWEANLTNCSGRSMLGPIAVMGAEVSWNRAKIPDEIKDAFERLKAAREAWKKIQSILEISDPRVVPKPDNPYANVGSVLSEYGKNIEKASQLLDRLASKVLIGSTLRGLGDLVNSLNAAMEDVRKSGQLAGALVGTASTQTMGVLTFYNYRPANPDQAQQSYSLEPGLLTFTNSFGTARIPLSTIVLGELSEEQGAVVIKFACKNDDDCIRWDEGKPTSSNNLWFHSKDDALAFIRGLKQGGL